MQSYIQYRRLRRQLQCNIDNHGIKAAAGVEDDRVVHQTNEGGEKITHSTSAVQATLNEHIETALPIQKVGLGDDVFST